MIVSVILHIALQPTGLHLAFNLPLSKLYTNSLMSSLNSRTGWQYDSSGLSANRPDQQRGAIGGIQRPRNVNVNMLGSDNGRRPVSKGSLMIRLSLRLPHCYFTSNLLCPLTDACSADM